MLICLSLWEAQLHVSLEKLLSRHFLRTVGSQRALLNLITQIKCIFPWVALLQYKSSSISSIVKFSQFKPLTISTYEINFNQFNIIWNKVYEFMPVCLVVLTTFVAWQPFTYYHILLVAEALSSLQTLFKFYNKIFLLRYTTVQNIL